MKSDFFPPWRAVLGVLLVAASCSPPALAQGECRICRIALSEGMERLDVEKKVATALGAESGYTPYGDALQGGTVEYREGPWTLRVVYSRGTPAPRVINAQGVGEHWPPIDSRVVKYALFKSAQPKKR